MVSDFSQSYFNLIKELNNLLFVMYSWSECLQVFDISIWTVLIRTDKHYCALTRWKKHEIFPVQLLPLNVVAQ